MPLRRRKKTQAEFDQETIGHGTFYEPSSAELLEPDDDYYVNDLLNRNYALKQHLPVDK